MKKVFLIIGAVGALVLSSCTASIHTATPVNVSAVVSSTNVADFTVGERMTYRYNTSSKDRRGGVKNCKAAAIAAFLRTNGNADVIVAPEFSFDTNLEVIEVTGRPGTYNNFRSVN